MSDNKFAALQTICQRLWENVHARDEDAPIETLPTIPEDGDRITFVVHANDCTSYCDYACGAVLLTIDKDGRVVEVTVEKFIQSFNE